MKSELEEKTGRIVSMLGREDLDAVLLNGQHNFAWLTGGGTNGVDLGRENGVATLLVSRTGKRYIFANSIEIGRMLAEEVNKGDFEPVEFSWQDEKAIGGLVVDKARSVLERGARLASDLPIDSETPAIENKVAECRYSLTSYDTERFRDLGRDAGTALRSVIDRITPGETELEIAEKMRHELALSGIASVVTLVAADDRIKKFRHPIPTENRWRKTLMLVTCAKRKGLIASLTRIVCRGQVPDELNTNTETAAFVNAKVLAATMAGKNASELYQTLADAYAEKGFGSEINLHHQGGAAGYRTRDWVAHANGTEIVEENQAFAWNPSITGTKVEETVIVLSDGVEILTASPDFPQISTIIDGREYLSPGILSI